MRPAKHKPARNCRQSNLPRFLREGGNCGRRCRPARAGHTRCSTETAQPLADEAPDGIIHADPFPTLAFAATPQALCAARRVRGDRGGVRCRGRRSGNRRVCAKRRRSTSRRSKRTRRRSNPLRISRRKSRILKASLEAANKAAHSQIAKLSDRLEPRDRGHHRLDHAAADGAAPARHPRRCRLRARARAAAEPPPARLAIVPDWSIRETRDGYRLRAGSRRRLSGGAGRTAAGPRPGRDRSSAQDGRWLVVTPKGIIVSMRDRRYFEQF